MSNSRDRQVVECHGGVKSRLDFNAARKIADGFRNRKDFRKARAVLEHVIAHFDLAPAEHRKAHQRLAMAHYHDGEYGRGEGLATARRLLEAGQSFDAARRDPPDKEKAEHLAIGGAIAKRRHAVTGRLEDLEEAQTCYDAAVVQATCCRDAEGRRHFNDNGYAAINAAFVRELIAAGSADARRAAGLRREADRLRHDIVASLSVKAQSSWNWWEAATYAEAMLGLGDAEAACDAIKRFPQAAIEDLGDWERETTARQLARLAAVYEQSRDRRLGRAVGELLGHIGQCRHPHYPGSLRGSMGLALSGGGFRASLFHLGVLARLADFDLLRHVGVLSCVSGGSIVGASYYLRLKRLLEEKPDAAIMREDYVWAVYDVIAEFTKGVGAGVRTKALGRTLWDRVKGTVGWGERSTRTEQAAALLDEHFYGNARTPLQKLLVAPAGTAGRFVPKLHNWRRAAKVPMLVINATTLNSGNNFQFTATWIGEPDSDYYEGIDHHPTVARKYLDSEVPDRYRDFPLSTAVAASAGVPLAFPPLRMPGLEKGRTVTLADGGLQDNQGLGALVDQDCSHVFVSDASGQMAYQAKPKAFGPLVLWRSSEVQARTIRSGVFTNIGERAAALRLRGSWVIHMAMDLEDAEHGGAEPITPYGMPVRVQQRLAALRTDLDVFSDAEAQALMLSGYRLAGHVIRHRRPDFPIDFRRSTCWPFRATAARVDACDPDLLRELHLGRSRFGRKLLRRLPGYKKRSEG